MENRGGKRMVGRPAEPDELLRMSGCVFWMYTHGQPVVLWLGSGCITLVPETLPANDVAFLVKGDR